MKKYFLAAVFATGALSAAFGQGQTLVHGSRFERDLKPELSDELSRAQAAEGDVPSLVAGFRENHALMQALADDYDRAETQAAADSIKARFDRAAQVCGELDGRIGEVWESIFDSKSYVYNYLMDKNNRNDMLARFESAMDELRAGQAEWRGVYASDAIVDYLLQKRLLTDYEIALAGETGNLSAADSLRRVSGSLPRPEDLAGLEPVTLKEREFIDVDSKDRVYRLELSGAGEIPPEMREAIRTATAGPQPGRGVAASNIVRSGNGFAVTPLDGATAVKLRESLHALPIFPAGGFEIKIVKNAE